MDGVATLVATYQAARTVALQFFAAQRTGAYAVATGRATGSSYHREGGIGQVCDQGAHSGPLVTGAGLFLVPQAL